ncbi:MAG TPA: FHA domain-containing protein, partial [Polyangiaceae bacterium]|nr:FHA domain-containing protein [Polyangiaceae bacterium]
MIRLEVRNGTSVGKHLESSGDVLRIGRADDNDLVLSDGLVSGQHAKIVYAADHYVLADQRSTNGTAVIRHGERIALDAANNFEAALATGDVVELGSGEQAIGLVVTLQEDPDDARFVAVRRIEEMTAAAGSHVERHASNLDTLYRAQTRIGAAGELTDVLVAICDAVFELVPRATHTTIILRDDDEDGGRTSTAGYVPVITRLRGQEGPGSGPIPITRSVFRKVVTERAAVLAADATSEVGQTESLIGARIRSTLGVPLWKGEEILGVLQMDNRESAGVFTSGDLEIVGLLAHNASLAVANARLVKRLR